MNNFDSLSILKQGSENNGLSTKEKLESFKNDLEKIKEKIKASYELTESDKRIILSIEEKILHINSIQREIDESKKELIEDIKKQLWDLKRQITNDYKNKEVSYTSDYITEDEDEIGFTSTKKYVKKVYIRENNEYGDFIDYISDFDWDFESEKRNDWSFWRALKNIFNEKTGDIQLDIVWEAQFREEIKRILGTEEKVFDFIVNKLWIESVNWVILDNFDTIINNINSDTFEKVNEWKDFWSTLRNRIFEEIKRRIESWATLDTILSWKDVQMSIKQNEVQQEVLRERWVDVSDSEINSIIEQNKKIQEILSKLPEWVDKNAIIEAIKYESTTFILWLWKVLFWGLATFNVKNELNKYLNSISIW